MMDAHERIRELVALAAAGAVSAGEQCQVERHAAMCSECRSALEAFATIGRELAAMPATLAPPALAAKTLARIATAHAGDQPPFGLLSALGVFSWLLTAAGWMALAEATGRGYALGWFAGCTLAGWLSAGAVVWALRFHRKSARRMS